MSQMAAYTLVLRNESRGAWHLSGKYMAGRGDENCLSASIFSTLFHTLLV